MKWCAWCGETIDSTDRRRKFCDGRCANSHATYIGNEKLMAQFDADEDLTKAQFSRINPRINPRVLKPRDDGGDND